MGSGRRLRGPNRSKCQVQLVQFQSDAMRTEREPGTTRELGGNSLESQQKHWGTEIHRTEPNTKFLSTLPRSRENTPNVRRDTERTPNERVITLRRPAGTNRETLNDRSQENGWGYARLAVKSRRGTCKLQVGLLYSIKNTGVLLFRDARDARDARSESSANPKSPPYPLQPRGI